MNEEFPSSDEKEVSEQELVDALKSKKIEDQEVFQLLQKWTLQEEKRVKNSKDSIELNRRRAKIYVEAGYVTEGLEVLESALTQAWNEQRLELYNQILTDINEIVDSP